MYRVIIVDDEPWAIKGIRNAFSWKKYGFEIIGQFTSSHEAFEFICEERPNLVFTDIRMPEISGLDLIKMTKARDLDVAFIIVSGFSEFAYAQEALRHGALDYCLKPIDIEMADPLIEKVALHFSKKRSIRNDRILEALTSTDKSELKQLTPFFEESSNGYFRVVVICSNRGEKDYLKPFDSKNTLEVELGSRKTLYILRSERRAELDEGFDYSVLTHSAIKSAGMSSVSKDDKNIAKLIKESDIAASNVFLHGEQGIYPYEQKLNLVKPFIDEISSMIREGNFEQIDDMKERLVPYFNHNRLGMGEVVFFWNQAVSALVGSYYEQLKDMDLEFLNYAELKERFENFDSLCSFLYDIFIYLKQLNDQSINESETNTHFSQMVNYIDNHFQNKLYLKELSVKFYINQVYCCQLFKKNLGKTFSEYVTELRINKACELLKHTELSIEEIASEAGYFDYYYFNKVFKKECGITPAKFRKARSECRI
ncbi:response regulator transcription factor [Paenibacillus arenilitoris]|uniref:Response regulator n=1 Tax=Paenibacillus arenilitoris TaxID=2772299 RepID=A0A927CTR3_9BACL|nr:response regulator [Paenibacillus arenilitoris]MBD2871706.1 response regulator [Paenibacillus arenilitoris]